uniref:Secreted protein n=1 Tax=Aquila chrysaetos chrysaetos TaxID=223781 RepID=A0A663FKH3_AQUCH
MSPYHCFMFSIPIQLLLYVRVAEGQTKQRQTESPVRWGNQNNLPSPLLLKAKAALQKVVETASV